MKIGIYPGSFDPVTIGHLDIIRRAAAMFDRLVVSVMVNAGKKCMFDPETRVEFIRECVADIPNVSVTSSSGLLVDYARSIGATTIVKGLRAATDFENEFQMALINKRLAPEIETAFLVTSSDNMFLSSSVVKEVGSYGADISPFVPHYIVDKVMEKISGREEKTK